MKSLRFRKSAYNVEGIHRLHFESVVWCYTSARISKRECLYLIKFGTPCRDKWRFSARLYLITSAAAGDFNFWKARDYSPSLDFGLKFRYPGILDLSAYRGIRCGIYISRFGPFPVVHPSKSSDFSGLLRLPLDEFEATMGLGLAAMWLNRVLGRSLLEFIMMNGVWAVLCLLPLWPVIRKRQNWASRWRIGKSRGGEGLYYCEIRGWRGQQAGAGATTGALAEATRMNITGSFELFWTMLNMKIC